MFTGIYTSLNAFDVVFICDGSLTNMQYLNVIFGIHIKEQNLHQDKSSKWMYDLYCDVTSASFQTSDGRVFKMAMPSVFMGESLTILIFFSISRQRYI